MNPIVERIGEDHVGVLSSQSSALDQRSYSRRLLVWNCLPWRSIATIASVLIAWQILSVIGAINPSRFPSPAQTFRATVAMIEHPFAGHTLFGHIGASLIRWIFGVALAIAVGITFGAALAWNPTFRAATRPIFEFLRYIPPLAWVPLAIIILGPSLTAEVFIVFVGAVPPVIINVWTGVAGVDPVLTSAAKTLGAGSMRTLLLVAIPAATLNILTGVRVAVANGWASLIGAELVGAQSGLGFIIITAQTSNRADDILTGMLFIGLIGAFIDIVLRRTTRRLTFWHGSSL